MGHPSPHALSCGLDHPGLDRPVKRHSTMQPSSPASPADVPLFFDLSAAIGLTADEECALLDVTRPELAQLRYDPDTAFERGGAKLQRRLAYAMTLLIRMKSALEC